MGKEVPDSFAPERIMVIQLRQIGDVLLTTPAVRALRGRFPEARISFMAEPIPSKVLEGNPNIDELIIRDPRAGGLEPVRTVLEVRKRKFDLVVDFLANPRTSVIALLSGARVTLSYAGNRRSFLYTHTAKPEGIYSASRKVSILRVLGVSEEPADLDMAVPERAFQKIDGWLRESGLADTAGPLVCMEPFSKWPVLEYPAEHHLRLAEMMAERWNAAVVVCWGPGRQEEAERFVSKSGRKLHLAPPTDLHELAALYSRADLWVGNDTGARHIAASQRLSTFAVFGPTDDAWTPPGPLHRTVGRDQLPCRPCNKRNCKNEDHRCMWELSPDEVFSALDDFWKGLNK